MSFWEGWVQRMDGPHPRPVLWMSVSIVLLVAGLAMVAAPFHHADLALRILGLLWIVAAPIYFLRWRRDAVRKRSL